MHKLMLVYPNQRWQKQDLVTTWNLNPATLCLLAAMVRDLVEVRIVDAQFRDLSREQFAAELAAFQPDAVGISVLTSEYRDTLDIAARLVREACPAAVVIAGGVHVTVMTEYVMRNPDIDYAAIGEGEHVLRQLVLFLQGRGERPASGLAWRQDGRVVCTERALVDDLRALPWPAYDLVDLAAYAVAAPRHFNPQRPPALPYVRMTTTRGCPCGCSFCQVEQLSGKRVRARDPEDVVAELTMLRDRYGIRSLIIDDDNLLLAPRGYAKRLFRLMIERRLGLAWIGIAFALFRLDDETLDLMRDSGCVGINVAVESGTERVLKQIIRKPLGDLARVPDVLRRVRERGLYVIANFILGFPGETWDEIRATVRFAETCGADYVKFFVAVPLYGTPLYHLARRAGTLVHRDEFPPVDWRYAQIRSDEWTAQDITVLRAYEWDRINFAPERIARVAGICGVTVQELQTVRKATRDQVWRTQA